MNGISRVKPWLLLNSIHYDLNDYIARTHNSHNHRKMCSNLDCEFGCTVFLAEECLRQLCAEYHSGICTGTKCARHFGHISFSSTSPTLCERPASSPGRDHLLKSRPQFDISTSTWSQAPAAEEQKERESSAYCITGFGSESWPIRVSFQQLGGKGTEALIEIKAFGQWTEFRNWLRTVFMRRYSFYSHKLLEELVDVWATNGRSFALLSLPLELRQQIYLCALGHTISPQLKWGQGNQTLALGTGKHYSHRPLGKEALSGHVRPDDPDIEKPNTNLLLVSKQIYSEVLETGWELTYKRFGENFRIFGQLLVTKMKMLLPPHALSKIQFDLNNDDYMKLIGFDTSCLSHRWYQMMQYKGTFPHLSILQNIPSLREVDFRFMSPHNVEAVDAFVGKSD